MEVEFSTENAGEFGNYATRKAGIPSSIPQQSQFVHCLLRNNNDGPVGTRENFLNPVRLVIVPRGITGTVFTS